MNRRGFLAMLAGALAEPLVPSGKAFSFLGGIYRPAWEEVPTVWPIPSLTLYDKNSLKIVEGDALDGARDIQEFQVEAEGGRGVGTFNGVGIATLAKLFRDRSGNWKILQAPGIKRGAPNLTIARGVTIPAACTTHWTGSITFVGPGPEGKSFIATCS